jgi:hypothetical protein
MVPMKGWLTITRSHSRFRRTAAGLFVAAVLCISQVSVADAQVVQPTVTPSLQTNGRVTAITIVGSTAYIGGKFTSVRPPGDPLGTGEVTRNHVAAIDLDTDTLLPWNPNANGTVQSIVLSGDTVYLGGSFTKVGGKGHARVAAVDDNLGAPVATFKPTGNAAVMTLQVSGGSLLAGGSFTTMDGAPASYLAAVTLDTGALVPGWSGNADAPVLASALTPDGTKFVVGGSLLHLDGVATNHLGAISPTTGALVTWGGHTPYKVIAMTSDATGVYAGGDSFGGNFAHFNPTTGKIDWYRGTDGNVQAVGTLNGDLYAGGHFANYCGPIHGQDHCTVNTPRTKILAVSETASGALEAWKPVVNSVLGVFAIAGGDNFLVMGGDFTQVAGTAQQGLAMFHS